MSHKSRSDVRAEQWVSAIRDGGGASISCLRSSCNHMTGVAEQLIFVQLALKVVMKNDRVFVDVILLHL